jgi:MFS family permease
VHRYDSLRGKGLVFLFFLWFLLFMNFTGRTILSPILPLLEDEFVVSHAKASSLFMFVSAGYGLALMFSGFFEAVLGPRKAIIVGLASMAFTFFLISFIKIFALLYVCTFAIGVATGLYLPSVIPIITGYYEERIWGRTIAIHDSATSVSFFAAPFITVCVLLFLPWRGIFVLMGSVMVICTFLFAFVVGDIAKVQGGKRYFIGSLLARKSTWLMGITWAFGAAANFGVFLIVPLYLTKELSMEVGYANTIFGFSRLGGVLVSVSAGFIVDRFSLKKTMFLLMVATGLLTMLLAARDMGGMEWRLFLQASISIGFFPLSLVAISRMFESEMRGQATGLIVTFGVVFGIGFAPYLLGLSGDLISFRFGIFILGILTTLSSACFLFLKGLK